MNIEIEKEVYEQIAELIYSEKSPVGIDAQKTHVYILHLLDKLDKRLTNIETQLNNLDQ